jgi:hypothetical protein
MRLQKYISEAKIATHVTDADSKETIMKKGFKASKTGWQGPGVYFHLGKVDPKKRNAGGKRAEGKGDEAVYVDYSNLKINDSGKPEELTDNQWRKLMMKDGRVIDKKLISLGYDGVEDGRWLRVFKQSANKLRIIK